MKMDPGVNVKTFRKRLKVVPDGLGLHCARNFFKTFHGPNIDDTGISS